MARPEQREVAPTLSVVIPTLNEAAVLPALLAQLAAQEGVRCEVIVADGGSSDGSVALAQAAGAVVITAPRGRAAQLNAGVAAARADWLLCLHADSQLDRPDQLARALALMRADASGDQAIAGHWPLRFTRAQPGHARLFRQLEAKSASNRPGTVNGDQGLLIHRAFLCALGGFDASLPFFEDQRLATKIFASGRFLLLPGVLHTSARRFEVEGHGARLLLMALIVGAEAAGLHNWLAALSALYREQREATRLSPQPFIQSLTAHIAGLPHAQQQAVWRAAGSLLAGNAWQLALTLDVQAGTRTLPHFDRHLAPLLQHSLAADLLGAGLGLALRTAARL